MGLSMCRRGFLAIMLRKHSLPREREQPDATDRSRPRSGLKQRLAMHG